MNKKILTAAIGAALVAGPLAAQADLKISGRVAGSLTSADGQIQFQDNGNTRLQFDASDESGWFARLAKDMRLGRLKVNSTTTTTEMTDTQLRTDRDQYVGIKSSFGSFRFGRIAGAVKNIEADPYIATFLELRNNATKGGAYGSSSFQNGMIAYDHKFGDATVRLDYVAVDAATGAANGALGASIVGKAAGARFYAGYNNQGNGPDAFYKLGGSMKFGMANVVLNYEDNGTDSNYGLGVDFGMGNGQSVNVHYADKGLDTTAAYYRVAYMKKASKKARFWVGYAQNGNKNQFGTAGDTASYGAGARVDF